LAIALTSVDGGLRGWASVARPGRLGAVRRLCIALAVVLLSLAPCSIAAAQGLGPQAPSPLTQDPTTTAPTVANPDASKDSGLSTLQLVLIFGSAIGVLAGIAWVILRDAHAAAPVEDEVPQTAAAKKLSARERERQQAQRRKKAKHVRQQRKHNRPR
jgi:hypothetical protein